MSTERLVIIHKIMGLIRLTDTGWRCCRPEKGERGLDVHACQMIAYRVKALLQLSESGLATRESSSGGRLNCGQPAAAHGPTLFGCRTATLYNWVK